MLGDGADAWSPERIAAWNAFFELSRRLFGNLESVLQERHELTGSTAGLLGRLEAAPHQTLRLSTLADAMELSLSRVSRLVDALEDRGLVERLPCPSDARAVNAHLTAQGTVLAHAAQATILGEVERLLFGTLTDTQVYELSRALTRMLSGISERPPAPSD
jgi:DNA-binding MarR family transcriptional regulator